MPEFDLQMILNLVIAGLLLITIVFCWLLNVRLKNLRVNGGELRSALASFSESVDKAQNTLVRLKGGSELLKKQLDSKADELIRDLDQKLARARLLVDELKILNESAEGLANRIDKGIEQGRKVAPPPVSPLGNLAGSGNTPKPSKPLTAKDKNADPLHDDDDGEWEEDKGLMDELSVRSEVERELLQTLRQNK